MDTKRAGQEGKTLLEFDSKTRTHLHKPTDENHSESLTRLQTSHRSVLPDPKQKGRPKRSSPYLDKPLYSSLREGAIEEYLHSQDTVLEAYQHAGSLQADLFLTRTDKEQSLFRYLYQKKQVKFQGIPEPGDMAFLDMAGEQIALIHSFSVRENRLRVFSKESSGHCQVVPLLSWFCFGWFLE